MSGELARGWRKSSVVIGPIAFLGLSGYRDDPDSAFRARGDRYPSLKALAVVTGTQEVTVSIPAREADDVRLLYDPSSWGDRNWYPLDAGDTATVFSPCKSEGYTQFNGGFLVSGRMCADLEVTAVGREPLHRLVSFGDPSCRS